MSSTTLAIPVAAGVCHVEVVALVATRVCPTVGGIAASTFTSAPVVPKSLAAPTSCHVAVVALVAIRNCPIVGGAARTMFTSAPEVARSLAAAPLAVRSIPF